MLWQVVDDVLSDQMIPVFQVGQLYSSDDIQSALKVGNAGGVRLNIGVGDGCPPIAWCCFDDNYCVEIGSSNPPNANITEEYCRSGRLMSDPYYNPVRGNFVLGPCP